MPNFLIFIQFGLNIFRSGQNIEPDWPLIYCGLEVGSGCARSWPDSIRDTKIGTELLKYIFERDLPNYHIIKIISVNLDPLFHACAHYEDNGEPLSSSPRL